MDTTRGNLTMHFFVAQDNEGNARQLEIHLIPQDEP